MKRYLGLLLLVIAVGCGKSQNSNPRLVARGGPGSPTGNMAGPTYNNNSMVQWTQLSGYTQQSVVDFVSTGIPQSQVGNVVNCTTQSGQPCAVLLNISVNPMQNNFNPLALTFMSGSQTSYQAVGTGLLTIAIYDSYSGGSNYPIVAPVTLQSGTMNYTSNGGNASVIFGDDMGNVTVAGNIQGTNFQGVVSFNNNNDVNTNQPIAENLAQFSMNICAVFQCN
jgi:hypothetical protein